MEHVSPNPDIILDGAHNPSGARALARYLERFYKGRRLWLIYGAMRDKAIDEISEILFPLAHELMFITAQPERALRAEALVEMAGRGRTVRSVAEAIEILEKLGHEEDLADDVVVITGSLYLVGEARTFFLQRSVQKW